MDLTKNILNNRIIRFTPSSYMLLSGFLALIVLIGYVWSPLLLAYIDTYDPALPFWSQFDWLLLGNFLVMTFLIMVNADIKKDVPIALIGLAGGLVIEAWGTQTLLWTYYTNERPPLWIIPAWAIASLSIDRLYRLINVFTKRLSAKIFDYFYWVIFGSFYILMLIFIWPTINKSLTIMALFLCAFLILTPLEKRQMLLVFIAGAGLGYFLEVWGTTRQCWTYYTLETPPFFAIMAHGMAAVSFWRVLNLYQIFLPKLFQRFLKTSHS